MPQFWAGFVLDKIDTREVDNGICGWGTERHRAPAIFTSKATAKHHYEDVRKIEVRVVSTKKRK